MSELDWRDWVPRLAGYYADLLKSQPGVANAHLYNLEQVRRRGLVADLTEFIGSSQGILARDTYDVPLDGRVEIDLPVPGAEGDSDGDDDDEESAWDPAEDLVPDRRAVETLLRISMKQESDPHNRETVLGYPLVGRKVGRRAFLGPLLLWEVSISHRPRQKVVRLSRLSTTPSLNTILLGKLAPAPEIATKVGSELLPLILDEDFDPSALSDVLLTLSGIVTPGQDVVALESLAPDGGLREVVAHLRDLRDGDPITVTSKPIVVNGSRSQAFLLTDLSEIAEQGKISGDSVLSQVVGDIPSEDAPQVDPLPLPFDDTGDGGNPLWFPFVSNESQRAVAQIAERSKVLTVQGPPGTGKSQTIANLVCHLVTEGHSVLVTSHHRKAMEVLSNMLSGFDSVALSMLSGDRESIQKLKTKLASIPDSVGADESDAVRRAEEDLRRTDEKLRQLARRYHELSRMEHEEFPQYVTYESVRDQDHIAPGDSIVSIEPAVLVEALREWAELYTDLHDMRPALDALFRPGGPETSRVRERQTASLLARLLEVAESIEEPVVGAARAVGERVLATASAPADQLQTMDVWLRETAPEFERNFRDLNQDPSQPGRIEAWIQAHANTGPDRLLAWRTRLEGHQSALVGYDFDSSDWDWERLHRERSRIRTDTALLRDRRPGLLRWLFDREVRRARARLTDLGFPLQRSSLEEHLNAVAEALNWVALQLDLRDILNQLSDRLPIEAAPATAFTGARAWRSRVQDALAAITLVERVPELPVEQLREVFGQDFTYADLGSASARGLLLGQLEGALRMVNRALLSGQLAGAIQATAPWEQLIDKLAECIRTGSQIEGFDHAAERLRTALGSYPGYSRLLDLEEAELSGLPRTIDGLKGVIDEHGQAPTWVLDAGKAVEAHRLSGLLRGSLQAHPDDLQDVADTLRRAQEQRRATIAALIRHRRQASAIQAMQRPSTRVPLLELQRLLSKKRLNASLLAMRNRIDYRAVLSAFPCWILTIDDATRVFPPAPGLFDFLIVDEASQCAQASALPLAYRAKRMIVVGDRKQLQPASSRFMSNSVIASLQDKYRISSHPKATFLDGKDSLLDLAEACSNASRMLDEHFRCDPAIIRWSNNRYYDNRLKIMTPRRRDRAAVPVEIRVLNDADDDPDEKVNRREAVAVAQTVRRLIDSGEANGKTIGVISVFREQADALQAELVREFRHEPEVLKKHRVVAATADGFQGDERDVILYSFRYGPSSHAASVTSIQREEQRLNVAFTRAKQRAICFISLPVNQFPHGAIRSFLEHGLAEQNRAETFDTEGDTPDQFDSDFERQVCHRLRDRGLRVTTQVPCARYRIDLVAEDEEGRQLAVECDGEWKHDALGQLRPEDYHRQDILERAGWVVHRISGRRWLLNPEHEVDQTLRALERQPSRQAMRTLSDLTGDLDLEQVRGVVVPTPGEAPERDTTPAPSLDLEEAAPQPRLPDGAIRKEAEHRPDPGSDSEEEDERTEEPMPAEAPKANLIFNLNRWITLQPSVEWEVHEQLDGIRKLIDAGMTLMPKQEQFLSQVLEWARTQGFDPDDPPTPDLFPRHLDLTR